MCILCLSLKSKDGMYKAWECMCVRYDVGMERAECKSTGSFFMMCIEWECPGVLSVLRSRVSIQEY